MVLKLEKPSTDRKRMLIQLAILALSENYEYITTDFSYDDAECDASCLAEDLRIEFDITDDELEFSESI